MWIPHWILRATSHYGRPKSRGRGFEWPNFVDNPKKWGENSQYNVRIDAFGQVQCEALKAKSKVQRKKEHSTLLAMSIGQRLCINFSVSRVNFLTTLRSHSDITCSCYFGYNGFSVDVNYSYIYLVNYSYSLQCIGKKIN